MGIYLKKIVNTIKELFKMNIIRYLIVAAMAFIVELSVSNFIYNLLMIEGVISHISGVVAGFVFQSYFILKFVYNQKISIKNLFIFFNTFILGLIISSIIFSIVFYALELTMMISKIAAMVLTFIVNFLIRDYLFKNKQNNV